MGKTAQEQANDELRQKKLEHKLVLKQLREHSEELDKDKEKAVDPRDDLLGSHFTRAEANSKKATKVDQKLLDAQIFHKLGDYAKRQAGQLQTGLKDYDVNSFVEKLASLMEEKDDSEVTVEPNELDMAGLGANVAPLFKTFPFFGLSFMHGNSEAKPRQVKKRTVAKRARKGAVAEKPKELEKDELVKDESALHIQQMRKELQKRERLNFWEFVVDPTSFSRSIENVFHSSFLVKDGHAKLDLATEPPVIVFRDVKLANAAEQGEALEEDQMVNTQYIMRYVSVAFSLFTTRAFGL